MKLITIIAPKQDGLVAEVSRLLGDAEINLEALEASNVGELGIVSLTVNAYDKALEVLRDANYDAVSDDAAVVCIRDEPGSLARVTERLFEGGIVVGSIRILQRQTGLAMVAITVDHRTKALRLIRDLLVSDT